MFNGDASAFDNVQITKMSVAYEAVCEHVRGSISATQEERVRSQIASIVIEIVSEADHDVPTIVRLATERLAGLQAAPPADGAQVAT